MDAEDPLFLLYTSGSTGKPKGVVHVRGGFMVGTTYHLESFFDVGERDIFWCTSDIGWIVGHSYIVYAPLCAGVTTLFREGAIDYPNPGVAWEIVERYGVTKMFTAPTALRMFMRYGEQYPSKYDITNLKVIACAGETLNAIPALGRRQVGLRLRQLVANRTRRPRDRHASFDGHAACQIGSR